MAKGKSDFRVVKVDGTGAIVGEMEDAEPQRGARGAQKEIEKHGVTGETYAIVKVVGMIRVDEVPQPTRVLSEIAQDAQAEEGGEE